MLAHRFALSALLGCACSQTPEVPPAAQPAAAQPGSETQSTAKSSPFLKGQLHCHSNASGDSNTPPEVVAKWYADHDYDFIVLTDHNRITDVPDPDGMLVLPGIELTLNSDVCSPSPEPGMQCLLHVNGLVVDPNKADSVAHLPRPTSLDRVELFAHAVHVTQQLGGVAMLNHPNFHYAADARVIGMVARRGLGLLEVANEAVDSNNQGDEGHPNTELLWDDVLASGARVWATATDDAHHYHDAEEVRARGELAFEGDRGWVMVRADRSEKSIRDALARGDFYASTGVTLLDVRIDGTKLEVELAAESPGDHEIRFVGSGGRELHRESGRHAAYDVGTSDSRYVRAVIEDGAGHKAWTQPLFQTEGGRS